MLRIIGKKGYGGAIASIRKNEQQESIYTNGILALAVKEYLTRDDKIQKLYYNTSIEIEARGVPN